MPGVYSLLGDRFDPGRMYKSQLPSTVVGVDAGGIKNLMVDGLGSARPVLESYPRVPVEVLGFAGQLLRTHGPTAHAQVCAVHLVIRCVVSRNRWEQCRGSSMVLAVRNQPQGAAVTVAENVARDRPALAPKRHAIAGKAEATGVAKQARRTWWSWWQMRAAAASCLFQAAGRVHTQGCDMEPRHPLRWVRCGRGGAAESARSLANARAT